MWRFLSGVPKPKSSEQNLPNPNYFDDPKLIANVNTAVMEATKSVSNKRRGSYANYNDDFRYKVARYALENGDASAVRKFSKETTKPLNESTIRTWRKTLVNKEASVKANVDFLEKTKRGRPLLLGLNLDEKVRFGFCIATFYVSLYFSPKHCLRILFLFCIEIYCSIISGQGIHPIFAAEWRYGEPNDCHCCGSFICVEI